MGKRAVKYDRDTGEYVYLLNDAVVTKEEWHKGWCVRPTDFEKGECPTVKGDLDDFSHLNGGRGMWNPQVGGYCRNVDEVITKGRAKGYKKIG